MTPTKLTVMKKSVQMKILSVITVCDDTEKPTIVDQINEAAAKSEASRGVYVFSDMNPYVGHPNPLKEGQELFRKGLLSEAVLALEAEVLKNPDNAEGWRLLGIAHAENDDDQQVIQLMIINYWIRIVSLHPI